MTFVILITCNLQVRKVRNDVAHSTTLQVTKDEFDKCLNVMSTLVNQLGSENDREKSVIEKVSHNTACSIFLLYKELNVSVQV